MTKQEVYELVNKRNEELNKPFAYKDGYKELKEFTDLYPGIKLSNFSEVDIWQLMKCMVFLKGNTSFSYQEISNDFDDFSSYVDSLTRESLQFILEFFVYLGENGILTTAMKYFDETSSIREKLLLKKIKAMDSDLADKLFEFKRDEVKGYNVNINAFIFYFVINGIQNRDFTQLLYDTYITYLDMPENEMYLKIGKVSAKEAAKARGEKFSDRSFFHKIIALFDEAYGTNRIFSIINEIYKFVRDCETEEKHYMRENNKERTFLEHALDLLERGLKTKEIVNAKEIAKHIMSPTVRYAVLQLIYEHNSKYYKELDYELEELNKNDIARYRVLLNDFGITLEDSRLKSIMNNSVDDTRKILQIVSQQYNLSLNKVIEILRTSNLERVLKIKEYIENGILSISFISTNIDVFSINSNKFDILNRNIEVLNKHNFNPANFNRSIYVLLEESNLLEYNIELLDDYDLLKSLKTTSDYNFLIISDLAFRIDKLLELGYENFLRHDLSLLNSENIKRLEVLKALNIPVSTKEELESVLNGKFYIKDDELDNYIFNVVGYKEKVDINLSESDLNSFKVTPRTYNFNGVLISCGKVKRLLALGNDLYTSIFSNINLSDDEYNCVIRTLEPYILQIK